LNSPATGPPAVGRGKIENIMDIFDAIKRRDINSINKYLEEGSINEQDKNGMTPLMVAIDNEDYEIVKQLVKHKMNIDMTDKYGQTAIMLAAGRGKTDIVKEILKHKPNLLLKSKSGATAFEFAIENGNTDIAKMLK
jgi:ankyrin repeat protein